MRIKSFVLGCSFVVIVAVLAVFALPQPPATAMMGGSSCEGDLDGDGFVGVLDLLGVLSDWGCTESCSGDANADGSVDVQDVLTVLSNFGFCDGGTPCSMNSDCDDGDPCTIDICIGGTCVHAPDPRCNN